MERNIKPDRRTARTHRSIIAAFHELALHHDLKDITIKDIAEKADISRKTFYLHYHSIDDLISELQEDFFHNIYIHMGETMETKDGEEAFRRSLLMFAEDPEWNYLICSSYDYGRIFDITFQHEKRPWNFEEFLPNSNDALKPYISAYMIENLRIIFCMWYRTGMLIPAEKMAEIGTQAIFHGTNSLDTITAKDSLNIHFI